MESSTNNPETPPKERWQWQWQSNMNPWDKKETPQWKSYPLDQNYLIEKAYHEKKDEVDLGDHIVSVRHMIQTKKDSVVSQRPIRRRAEDDIYEMDRSQRYFETEIPKTINKIFGSLGDFVTFFSRRNQGILDFTNQFKELEKSNDLDILNQNITPKLVGCFEQWLLEPNLQKLKDPSLSQIQKKVLLKIKEPIEDLIRMFKKEFSSLEEFYQEILKAYTMNTGLYSNLNESLRNENWVQVDKLLPYAFCLCKAFFNSSLKPNLAEKPPSSRFLYRGTALDEPTQSFYDLRKNPNFSWNCMTSTTTNKEVAEGFMYRNVDLAKKKYPVIFIIEIPSSEENRESNYLKYINIHQYSAIPKENEVVLAPGSAFELVGVFTDQDKKTTIKIKLRSEIKSLVHRGMMMQGTLQSQMMTEKEAKVMCLEGEELSQALISLCGNQLIEEVEFCLCIFDNKRLKKMYEALLTLEKAKRLKFVGCMYKDNGEISIEGPKEGERCEITKIEVIEGNNFFQMICNEKYNQGYWSSLREFDIDFRSREKNLTSEELSSAASQGLKYLPQLTHLSLNLEYCEQITDKGVQSLTNELNDLTQLTNLNLHFGWCSLITNEGVNCLSKGLNSLPHLTHFHLETRGLRQLTDEGVNNLALALNSLTQLSHLNLDLSWGNKITVSNFTQTISSFNRLTHFNFHFIEWKGASPLMKLFNSLPQITHLNIHFYFCEEITEEEINCLVRGFESLIKLTYLNLDFSMRFTISEEEMNCLAKVFSSLTKLTHLNLNLQHREQITDDSVSSFAKGINLLSQLTHLNINFKVCEKITDDGLDNFAKCLNSLSQLTHLDLDFGWCKEITDSGVISLADGLNSLTQLRHLSLSLEECKEITSKGISFLMSQGLRNLIQLTCLILDFDSCEQITTHDFQILAEELLKRLVSLRSPLVNNRRLQSIDTPPKKKLMEDSRMKLVRDEKETFDEKVWSLQMTQTVPGSLEQSEESLTQDFIVSTLEEDDDHPASALEISEMVSEIIDLTSLTLNFEKYKDIVTDEFVHKLSCQVLGNLPQLRSLTLQFTECDKITDKAVGYLASYGLKPLANLAFLMLTFFSCEQITNKGVADLAWEGLRHLCQLKSLALAFGCCDQVGDEGLHSLLCHGLRPLSQLEALALDPSAKITDKGIDSFVSEGLPYLTQLKFLGLELHCADITDKGVNNLILRIVKNLPKLTFLDIGLGECVYVTTSTVQKIREVLHYFGFTQEVDCKTLLDFE